ncbi:MAG: acyltransferase [Chitinophagaceae bacterium]
MKTGNTSISPKGAGHPGSLKFLDGLRGFAALYVMIGHARWLLWEGGAGYNAHPGDYSFLEKLQVYFFGLFKYGHQMVLFFFVLSGFVIHLKQSRAIAGGRQPLLKDYFWKRLRRIMPPLVFALVLTFVCDKLVEGMNASIFLHTTQDPLVNRNISFDHSFTTLLGNLLFVQETYVPIFGSNGPLWSLKFEWWFYMLYPLFLLLNKRSAWWTFALIAALSLASIAGWSWGLTLLDDVLAYFLCWWLGCLAADIFAGRIKMPVWTSLLAACLLITIPFQSKLPLQSGIARDTLLAIGFFGMLNLFLRGALAGKKFPLLTRLKPLGDCSYTLYVFHMPLLVVFHAFITRSYNNALPSSMIFLWLSILILPILAYIIHFAVEKPFMGSSSSQPGKPVEVQINN